MHQDVSAASEHSAIVIGAAQHQPVLWRARWSVQKYHDPDGSIGAALEAGADTSAYMAYETIEREGNLLLYGGASNLWQCLIGNGTTTAGQALTYFNNAQAAIGVGDSTTAAAATQTNLQAATNKLRKGQDATYPLHTDGTTSGAATITFRSTFATGDANFAWQEWSIFNSTTDGTGRGLNRKVESLGTKTSSATWTFTCSLTLS